ncbi:MAG: hypothetical protein IJR68_11680 [Fretibacterium sp.]|nr:hypothetical protein [Fretibacterium sp.]
MSKNKLEEITEAAEMSGAVETPVAAEAVTPAAEPEQTVYVGPNVLPLALRRFQVFRGGLPPYVERAIEKIPEVRPLIVPVEKLDEARAKTEKAGTNEFRLFEAVKKAAEGVR